MAYIQSNGNTASVGNVMSCAFLSNVTAGSVIGVSVFIGSSPAFTSIVDSLGNTYTQQESRDTDGVKTWTAPSPSGGANTVTVTYSSGVQSWSAIVIAECGGRSGTVTAHNNSRLVAPGTGADAIIGGAVTAASLDDILYFVHDTSNLRTAPIYTAGTGYTKGFETGAGTGDITVLYRNGVSSGSQTPLATTSQGTDTYFTTTVALAAGSAGESWTAAFTTGGVTASGNVSGSGAGAGGPINRRRRR